MDIFYTIPRERISRPHCDILYAKKAPGKEKAWPVYGLITQDSKNKGVL